MVAGGVIGISDLSIPYAEQGILLSILVLGLLIAVALKLPLLISAVVVAIFALFHGYAHGMEMPSLSGGVTYSFGFALATMLLHMVGIGLGTGLQSLKAGRLTRVVGAVIAGAGIYLAVA
jgi:urease accessory protein